MHSKAAFCLRIQQAAAQADQITLYMERLFLKKAVTACQEELLIRQWRYIVTSGAA